MRHVYRGYVADSLAFLFSFVLLLLASLILLFQSEKGIQSMVILVNSVVPNVTINNVEGTLDTGFSIDSIIIDDNIVRTELNHITIDTQTSAYKDDHLYIKKVAIKTLNITTLVPSDNSKKTYIPDIKLPIDLSIDLISINSLAVRKYESISDDIQEVILFENFTLFDVETKNGWLEARHLSGTPIIAGTPMPIIISDPHLQLDNPHKISGQALLSYDAQKIGLFDANVTLGGTLTNYTLTGKTAWDSKQLIPDTSDIQLAIEGDYDRIVFKRLTITTSQGQAELLGTLSWEKGLQWDFSLDGKQIQSSHFVPDWPATINLKAHLQGSLIESRPEISINILSLSGKVKGEPVSAQGKISFKQGVVITEALHIINQHNYIKITGRASPPFNLEWDINATDMSHFAPNMKGKIVGKGILLGDLYNPSGAGYLNIDQFSFQDIMLKKANVVLKGRRDNHLSTAKASIKLIDLIWRKERIGQADLNLDIARKDNFLSLKGTGQLKHVYFQEIESDIVDLTVNGKQQGDLISGSLKGIIHSIENNNVQLEKAVIDLSGDYNKGLFATKGHFLASNIKQKGIVIKKADIVFHGGNKTGLIKGTAKGNLKTINYKQFLVNKADLSVVVNESNGIIQADITSMVHQGQYDDARFSKANVIAKVTLEKGLLSAETNTVFRRVKYQNHTLDTINLDINGHLKGEQGKAKTKVTFRQLNYHGIVIKEANIVADGTYKKGHINGLIETQLQGISYQGIKIRNADIISKGAFESGLVKGTITTTLKAFSYKDLILSKAIINAKGELYKGRSLGNIDLSLNQIKYKNTSIAMATIDGKGIYYNDHAEGDIQARLHRISDKGLAIKQTTILADGSYYNGGARGKIHALLDQINYNNASASKAIIDITDIHYLNKKVNGVTHTLLKNVVYQKVKVSQVVFDGSGQYYKKKIKGKGTLSLSNTTHVDGFLKEATLLIDGFYYKGELSADSHLVLNDLRYKKDHVSQVNIKVLGDFYRGKGKANISGSIQNIVYQGGTIQQVVLDAEGVFNRGKITGHITSDLNYLAYKNGLSDKVRLTAEGMWYKEKLSGKANATFKQLIYQGHTLNKASLNVVGHFYKGKANGTLKGTFDQLAYQGNTLRSSEVAIDGLFYKGRLEGKGTILLNQMVYQGSKLKQAVITMDGSYFKDRAKGVVNAKIIELSHKKVVLAEADVNAKGTYHKGAFIGKVYGVLKHLTDQQNSASKVDFMVKGGYQKNHIDGDWRILFHQLQFNNEHLGQVKARGKGSYINGVAKSTFNATLKKIVVKNATVSRMTIRGEAQLIQGKGKGHVAATLYDINYKGLTIAKVKLKGHGSSHNKVGLGVVDLTMNHLLYKDVSIEQADASVDLERNDKEQITAIIETTITQIGYQKATARRFIFKGKGRFYHQVMHLKGKGFIDDLKHPDFAFSRLQFDTDSRSLKGLRESITKGTLTNVQYQSVKIASLSFDGKIDHKKNKIIGNVSGYADNLSYQDIRIAHIEYETNVGQLTKLLQGNVVATLTAIEKGNDKLKVVKLSFGFNLEGKQLSANGYLDATELQFQDNLLASAKGNFSFKRNQQEHISAQGKFTLGRLYGKDTHWRGGVLSFEGNPHMIKAKGQINKLVVSGEPVKHAQFTVNGTPEFHQVLLTANHTKGQLTLQASGKISQQKWKGSVHQLSLKKTKTGDWILKHPISIVAGSEVFKGSEICLYNPNRGLVCTKPSWSKKNGFSLKAKLIKVPLAQFNALIPDNTIHLYGDISGGADINVVNGQINGQVILNLANGYIILKLPDGSKEKLAYTHAKIMVDMKGKHINTSIVMTLVDKGSLSGKATILLSNHNGKHRIKGLVDVNLNSLKWAQAYFPDINRLKGKVSGTVKVNGLIANPKITGIVKLTEGQFTLPDTGTTLTHINAIISSDDSKVALINGRLNAGVGVLNINGNINFQPASQFKAKITLNGRNLKMMDNHEVQLWVSPDLTFNMDKNQVVIEGTLLIPKGRIELEELPEMAIYESDDVVFIGEGVSTKKASKKIKALKVEPNISIRLGDDIKFTGFGLSAFLKGQFRLTHSQNDIIAQGSVNIKEGIYQSYGQKLQIDNGVLVFNGSPANPGLNIRTSRLIESVGVDDLTVGLQLNGTLQSPKSNIYSNPPLSESDALSYLLTGHSLGATTGGEAQLLVHAVRSLGISGSNSLLAKIGNTVGLDDINLITHDDYKKNQLSLGKRLGPKLYIRYITGIFDSFHKVAVNYQVNRRLKLEAVSGEHQSVDFIYEYEKD